MTTNELTRHDAPLSIRRGFTLDDLRLIRSRSNCPFTIHLHFPSRFCLVERLCPDLDIE
jgi:hypothetical protein